MGIGLPGVTEGGVYSHLIKHVSRLTQPGDIYVAGLDGGIVKDPLTVIILSTDSDYKYVNTLEELEVKTERRYSNKELAYKVCKGFQGLAYLYPRFGEGLLVHCDKTNLAFIDGLNDMKVKLNLHGLSFLASKQVEIEHRICFKQWLMSVDRFNISKYCPKLYEELLLATFDRSSSKVKLLADCSDHMIDAFDYAVGGWTGSILSGASQFTLSFYFPKGLKTIPLS